MISLIADEFNDKEKEISKIEQQAILAQIAGITYFNKVSAGERFLNGLHKLHGMVKIYEGLSKLSPDMISGSKNLSKKGHFIGTPILKYPQVDMFFQGVRIIGNDTIRPDIGDNRIYAGRNANVLFIANGSSNEHQILNDFYKDKHAISTVKLLQLAHKRHLESGGKGTGFVSFARHSFKEANLNLERAKKKYFNHLGSTFSLKELQKKNKSQWEAVAERFGWDMKKRRFDKDHIDGFHSFAYMTPGEVFSDDGNPNDHKSPPSYIGHGALIFSPYIKSALISGNGIFTNGGYGSRISEDSFADNNIYESHVDYHSDGTPYFDGVVRDDYYHDAPAYENWNQEDYKYVEQVLDYPEDYRPPTMEDIQDFEDYILDVGIDDLHSDELQEYLDMREEYQEYDKTVEELQEQDRYYDEREDCFDENPIDYDDIEDKVLEAKEAAKKIPEQKELNLNDLENKNFDELSEKLRDKIKNEVKAQLTPEVHPEGKSIFNMIGDPVDIVSGTYYIDESEISLNGRFPMQISRNYSSNNSEKGDFGYGWKGNIVSFLSITSDGKQINAAEMNGSVIVYTKQKNNRWIVETSKNPQLSNNAYIYNWIEKRKNKYIIHGSDGSLRTYKVMSFPIAGFDRKRPYITSWTSNSGNTIEFEYGQKNQYGYGKIVRIKNKTGNFVGIKHNKQGLIKEIYSDDGRRSYYEYDSFADLIKVILADDSEISYDYEHKISDDREIYSTHRIIRETKPEGRVLENKYDDKGRVIEQRATKERNSPVPNAFFKYVKDSTESDPISLREAIDINRSVTKYKIYDGLIFYIENPMGETIRQSWYLGNNKYFDAKEEKVKKCSIKVRSLKQRISANGLVEDYFYDNSGNIIEIKISGDDLSGDGSIKSKTTKYRYNSNNLVIETIGPNFRTANHYENILYPFLVTKVEKFSGDTLISTIKMEYEEKKNATGVLRKIEGSGINSNLTSEIIFENDDNGFPFRKIEKTGTKDPDIITDLSYNKRGLLSKGVLQDGFSTIYDYDIVGRHTGTRHLDKEGHTMSWSFDYYNQNGELEWEQGAMYNPVDYRLYKYDAAGNLIFDAVWRSAARSDGYGVMEIPGADQFSQQAITLYRYDKFGNLVKMVDSEGHIIEMEYDLIGRITRKTIKDDASSRPTFDERYKYSKNLFTTIHADGLKTIEEYTTDGRLKKRIGKDSSENSFVYDVDGRIVKQISPTSGSWAFSYDDAKNSVTKTHVGTGIASTYTYDFNGNLIEFIDGESYKFKNEYDALGRIYREIGPKDEITTHMYHSYSGKNKGGANNYKVFYPEGSRFMEERDYLGRIISRGSYHAKDGSSCKRTNYFYCNDGHCLITNSEHGKDFDYIDNFGNPVINKYFIKDDESYYPHLSIYDRKGRLVKTNIKGARTYFGYDSLDRMKSEIVPGGAKTVYHYDNVGNMASLQMPTDLFWNTTSNVLGQQTSEILGNSDFVSRQFLFDYDDGGLVKTKTDPNGVVHTYTYDTLGRLISESTSNGCLREYIYDKRSLILSISEISSDYKTKVEYLYDANHNVVQEAIYFNGKKIHEWHQTWDLEGRRTSLTAGEDFKTYGTDRYFSYDAADNMTETSFVLKGEKTIFRYYYGLDGRLKFRKNRWSTNSTYKYDLNGNPTEIKTGNDYTFLHQKMEWDGSGQLAKYYTSSIHSKNPHETIYEYSSRGSLTKSITPGEHRENVFTYDFDFGALDGLGIITQFEFNKNSHGENVYQYSWNAKDIEGIYLQREILDSTNKEALDQTSAYDQAGNLIFRKNANEEQKLIWDDFGRLIKVESTNYVWKAFYDGLGRRLRTVYIPIENGEEVKTQTVILTSIYDPEVEFLEVGLEIETAFAKRGAWKIYGPDIGGYYGGMQGVGGLEAVISDEGRLTGIVNDFFGTAVGKISLVKNKNNNLQWSMFSLSTSLFDYGPTKINGFEELNFPEAERDFDLKLINALRWRDRRLDPTGFIYMGARYYDSESYRFISADPLGHFATQNLYAYSDGDPINYFDPDGRFASAAYNFVKDNPGEATSLTADFIPGVGTIKAFQELFTGSDLITGGKVSRWGSGVAVLASFIPAGKAVFKGAVKGSKVLGRGSKAANKAKKVASRTFKQGVKAEKTSLSPLKKAVKEAHKKVGKQPKSKPGKFGSPQKGTSKKGYRLDPGHPKAPKGSPEAKKHINWWDYSSGKRGKGGKSGVIPVKVDYGKN